jgi:hypothetical protein
VNILDHGVAGEKKRLACNGPNNRSRIIPRPDQNIRRLLGCQAAPDAINQAELA